MKKQLYFLSPVEVVRVTSHNLAEVAEWCGGTIEKTESRRYPGRMDSYVCVPTPKGQNISWAFPSMFITKRMVITVKDELKVTYSVFRKSYFDVNYFSSFEDAMRKTWDRWEKETVGDNAFDKYPAAEPEKAKEEPQDQPLFEVTDLGKALIESGFTTTEAAIRDNIAKRDYPEEPTMHNHSVLDECTEACPTFGEE